MPRLWSSCALPTPESWSSCGELIAPPHRIDLAGVDPLDLAAMGDLDPGRLRAVEQDPVDHRVRAQLEVRPIADRVVVRARRAQPVAAMDVAVKRREPLLAVAIDIFGQLIAGLLYGFEERREQRARGRPALEHERAAPASPLIRAGETRLHLLEVRQAVGVVPVLHPRVAGPAFVVHRVAALEDHPVDRARPAEHLPAGVVDLAAVHVRLRLGLVLPVVEAVADRERQRGRHVDVDVPQVVHAARFDDEHP